MKKKITKYYANWCGPCKVYAKKFDKVKQQYKDQVNFEEVDIEQADRELLNHFKITSIPTTVIQHSDEEVEIIPGVIPAEELISKIKQ